MNSEGTVDLYWLPLGAGGHVVQLCGRLYEIVGARLQHRPRCDLYHSALEVHLPEGTYVIEQTPVSRPTGEQHGVVAGGAVGARWAGLDSARRVLDAVRRVPRPVWGRK